MQATITSILTLSLAFYNGWMMTLVVLAGMPIIAMATALQQGKTEADGGEETVQVKTLSLVYVG